MKDLQICPHLASYIQNTFYDLDARQTEETTDDTAELGRVDAASAVLVEHIEYPGEFILYCLQLRSW